MRESPIFIKAYEMLVWLLERTAKFPKNQRFLLAKRMENAALDLFEGLNHAALARGGAALAPLAAADRSLANLRLYNRLAKDLELLAFNQYEYLAAMLDEVGRLLGGWLKRTEKSSKPA